MPAPESLCLVWLEPCDSARVGGCVLKEREVRAKQRDLFESNREVGPRRSVHGGDVGCGRRKVARPLDSKKPLHLVLKSSHAKGKMSFLSYTNRLAVEQIIRGRAREFSVVIHGFENMGNHLHLVLKFKSRALFQRFLKTVSGLIARHVTKARRGKPFGKRFFDRLAFTRVVQGARDLRGLVRYLFKNEIEREFGAQARATIEEEQPLKRKRSRTRVRA